MDVRENLLAIRKKISLAAGRTGRSGREVQLVAVTKGVSVARIETALAAGVKILGENRVQELLAKQPLLPAGSEWHFVGHLQTNKVKYVLERVSLIHSLDSWRLAQAISRQAAKAGKEVNVLAQVNVAGEKTKYGLAPGEVIDFLGAAGALPGLKVRGLMTIAPAADNPEAARPVFRALRLLFERARALFPAAGIDYLSMGMSNDYLVAVEEGANLIRLGTAIFGARDH